VGAERFIGIPGSVGGGVYMNAGCHGAEFAEIVTEVTVVVRQKKDYGLRQPKAGRPLAGITDYGLRITD
jgi:UDP-N-acetylenolpyruvoylglucosamine reductase